MKVDVTNLDAKKTGDVELDDAIFAVEPRRDVLARMVNWQLAKRRSGNHKTKGISEIQGSTKKPFRQKGTGRARQGSIRATQMRGGQTVHGPVVRDHGHELTKKFRKLGLKTALSAKAAAGDLVVLDDAISADGKTKSLKAQFEKLGWNSVLVIGGSEIDGNFARAANNIPLVDVLPQQGANVYSILRRRKLVLTKGAVEELEARLK